MENGRESYGSTDRTSSTDNNTEANARNYVNEATVKTEEALRRAESLEKETGETFPLMGTNDSKSCWERFCCCFG